MKRCVSRVRKGGFPLSRKFYVRADVNLAGFTHVNKIKVEKLSAV